jgi:hypothetical protein
MGPEHHFVSPAPGLAFRTRLRAHVPDSAAF